jgi:hypothetical protein
MMANSTSSTSVRVTLSEQSISLLDQLAKKGIFGRNKAEVAARFVDEALRECLGRPELKLDLTGKPSKE